MEDLAPADSPPRPNENTLRRGLDDKDNEIIRLQHTIENL